MHVNSRDTQLYYNTRSGLGIVELCGGGRWSRKEWGRGMGDARLSHFSLRYNREQESAFHNVYYCNYSLPTIYWFFESEFSCGRPESVLTNKLQNYQWYFNRLVLITGRHWFIFKLPNHKQRFNDLREACVCVCVPWHNTNHKLSPIFHCTGRSNQPPLIHVQVTEIKATLSWFTGSVCVITQYEPQNVTAISVDGS
jgi:hypothetical protein